MEEKDKDASHIAPENVYSGIGTSGTGAPVNKQQSAPINYRETGAFVWALITYPIIWFLLVLLSISFTAKLLAYPLEKGNRFVLFISLGTAVLAALYVILKRVEFHFARREALLAVPIAPPEAPAVTTPGVALVKAPVVAEVEAPVETSTVTAPPEIPRNEWFYAAQGQKAGPVAWSVIRDLRQLGSIKPDTLVWSERLGNEWKPLSAFDLQTGTVIDVSPPLPPEVKKPYPPSTAVWLITLSPMIIYLAERAWENAGRNLDDNLSIWITIAAILTLSAYDAGLVRKSGRHFASAWILLTPGYLIARARALSEPMYHVAIWVLGFAGYLYLTAPGLFDGTAYLMDENDDLVALYGKVVDIFSSSETGKTATTRVCMLSIRGSRTSFTALATLEDKDDKILVEYQPL